MDRGGRRPAALGYVSWLPDRLLAAVGADLRIDEWVMPSHIQVQRVADGGLDAAVAWCPEPDPALDLRLLYPEPLPIDDGGIAGRGFFEHCLRLRAPVLAAPKRHAASLPSALRELPVTDPTPLWPRPGDRPLILCERIRGRRIRRPRIFTRMSADAAKPMDRRLIALLAFSTGATVANLYYAQPLLSAIGSHFGVSDGTAGLLVTVSQVFYGLGIVFLSPLGDLLDRRKLVVALLLVSCVALAGAAAAPRFLLLALAIGIAAATSVVAQILIPFASALAPEGERGHVVGLVMGGLLTGILLARTFSGLLAGATSWRVVFAIAAAAMALLALALWRAMPERRPSTSLPYRKLLGSVGELIRRESVLRRRMVYGACGFAGFSIVWTTLSFLLSDPPFDFGEATIGLFGLAGLAGAVGAMRMGRLHDRGHGRVATGAVLAAILLSWPIFALGRHSVPAILVGLALLDFGVQGQNVLSQGAIYALGRETTGRVTTAYVTSNFVGGAIGSAAGSLTWSAGGWLAVCAVGVAFAGVAIVVWLTEPRQRAKRRGCCNLAAAPAEPA